jgi:hypothetical protein
MASAYLRVNGVPVRFDRVWVHIQDPCARFSPIEIVEYRARVVKAFVDFVFDAPDKGEAVSWDQYLREEVVELGTAMMSVYFEKMSTISEASGTDSRCVIATLDAVIEDDIGVELRGRAIPFDPGRYSS